MKVLIIYTALVLLAATGYVKNVIRLIECDFNPSYKAETIRIIGVCVPPVGAVVGYINVGK